MCFVPRAEGSQDAGEKVRRQKPVIMAVAATRLAQIVARPDELIAFADNDPSSHVIEAKLTFDGGRNFDG